MPAPFQFPFVNMLIDVYKKDDPNKIPMGEAKVLGASYQMMAVAMTCKTSPSHFGQHEIAGIQAELVTTEKDLAEELCTAFVVSGNHIGMLQNVIDMDHQSNAYDKLDRDKINLPAVLEILTPYLN